jgi:hypothetical protein
MLSIAFLPSRTTYIAGALSNGAWCVLIKAGLLPKK